jgi:hypothetical protein
MKPYKLKHVPTGMYYQPHKFRGSNLSDNGKIYQTKSHGLSSYFRSDKEDIWVFIHKDTRAYKKTKDILDYQETYGYKEVKALTKKCDWIIEEI